VVCTRSAMRASHSRCSAELACGCLDGDIAQGSKENGFTDGVCTQDVVLVAGDKRTNILWCNQLYLMVDTGELTSQPVRVTACFHHNARGGVLGKVVNEAGTSELAFEDGFAVCILPDEMKGVLPMSSPKSVIVAMMLS